MNAKIDPKVVMDLSIFKIGGWNSLQPSNQKLLEEFFEENESRQHFALIVIGYMNTHIMIEQECDATVGRDRS